MTNERKIACLVVDDEPPALEVLKKYIAAVATLEVAATANNAIEALNILQTRPIDLIFLDIQMPQLLGTDLIRTLKTPPRVIFTTAHRKFAIEGYELDAVDYLLKPISFERFLKAVNKVLGATQPATPTVTTPSPSTPTDSFIHLRADRKTIPVALDDILYVESLRDYIRVVTRNKTIVTKQSISSLEESLPREAFIRIHRSYIVALAKVESYTAELVEIGRQQLPISRLYRLDVEKILQRRL
ncbi:MAG TPA: LytTR family DNA-binding domain-containing protein [Puia sp.]|uniref:LytR/AlgR family response regulator transcription factor n=1 Tax=Puia sp. TaxID=2045100 RepID=UPI002CFCFF49|nr:LytTR family DNA-binding domain-containing protein [Puia sp.]HVU95384.1 LytTR family DNA-binding domain-containing protein [Puia sp.]